MLLTATDECLLHIVNIVGCDTLGEAAQTAFTATRDFDFGSALVHSAPLNLLKGKSTTIELASIPPSLPLLALRIGPPIPFFKSG